MSLPNHVYAVILAGGSSTRFWPKSRQKSPKQLCSIGSATQSMLEITLARLDGFIPPERRMIVTHKDQIEGTREIVGDRCKHFLAEPDARNTGNALALASLELEKIHSGDQPAVMVSLHADHVIKKVDSFLSSIENAITVAETGRLTLLGIVPEGPETGYGYIERGEDLPLGAKVASFREKPELAIAEEYVKSGKFYWNAGIFVWRTQDILKELEEFLLNLLKN